MQKSQEKRHSEHGTRVVGVIPARMESRRLPGKPLRSIAGRAMIDWVYFGARRAASLDHLLVATDSSEILDHCTRNAIPALRTSSAHRSGTERLVEVMSRDPAAIYVNIQGDEPMVTAAHIELLLRPFGTKTIPAAEPWVSTLKVAMTSTDAEDPSNVKVVTDSQGRALYFSRARVPYHRGGGKSSYYKHLGLYAYSAAELEAFGRLPVSCLEQAEQLEQLRFLENRIPIIVVETDVDTIGVDTEEDLKRVAERLGSWGVWRDEGHDKRTD